jgi:glycosyltransferase involved in cell wall biosynthesis
MACGCPVASSTRASLGELVGDAALTFDPEDPVAIAGAIDRVTGDEPLRERLRGAGLERAARYTWEAAAARHRQVYERALRNA